MVKYFQAAGTLQMALIAYKDRLFTLARNLQLFYYFLLQLNIHKECRKDWKYREMMQRDHAVDVEGHWPFIIKSI